VRIRLSHGSCAAIAPLPLYPSEEVINAVDSARPAIELVGLCLPAAFRDIRWCDPHRLYIMG
jgi:hypothetical protein